MLYSFILETLMFVSLGAIVMIVARGLPRMEDEVTTERHARDFWAMVAKKVPLDRIDESFNHAFHKFLRKSKVFIMRADNIVTGKLKSFRSDNKRSGASLPSMESISENDQ